MTTQKPPSNNTDNNTNTSVSNPEKELALLDLIVPDLTTGASNHLLMVRFALHTFMAHMMPIF